MKRFIYSGWTTIALFMCMYALHSCLLNYVAYSNNKSHKRRSTPLLPKNISALNLHGSLMIISNVSKSIRAVNDNGKCAQDNFLNVSNVQKGIAYIFNLTFYLCNTPEVNLAHSPFAYLCLIHDSKRFLSDASKRNDDNAYYIFIIFNQQIFRVESAEHPFLITII